MIGLMLGEHTRKREIEKKKERAREAFIKIVNVCLCRYCLSIVSIERKVLHAIWLHWSHTNEYAISYGPPN